MGQYFKKKMSTDIQIKPSFKFKNQQCVKEENQNSEKSNFGNNNKNNEFLKDKKKLTGYENVVKQTKTTSNPFGEFEN